MMKVMIKRSIVLFFVLATWNFAVAQTKSDSLIINIGESSRVIFAIGDKKDLETLRQYDFQAVVQDLIQKLEQKDTTSLTKPAAEYLKPVEPVVQSNNDDGEDWDESWRRRVDKDVRRDVRRDARREVDYRRRYYGRRTRHSFNFDLGTNNYLAENQFPDHNNDAYTIKPWGSWYFGLNSTQRTRVARKFFLEWGLGVSRYNFKFEDERLLVGKDDNGVIFSPDTLRNYDFKMSKLTATFLNASFVPMLDFGGNSRKAMFFDGDHSESFRIGIGPYAGYRISSYSKLEFKDGADRRRERNHDNFYMNNIRYGLRLQIGFRDTDLFFNYDLNELFAANKGPKLNAFSFGITF